MDFRLFPLLAALLLGLSPAPALAESPILDSLAGTWTDLDGFASLGQCISSPSISQHYQCSPAQLSRAEKGRFEGRGTMSATDSVLAVSDAIRKDELRNGDLSALFQEYNYTDVMLNVDLNYVTKNFLIGVRPVRYQGQFEVHNPNLPLVSLAFRDDRDFHVGLARSFGGDRLRWSVGTTLYLLYREETIVEASLVDLASRPPRDLLDTQKMSGYFADVGTSLEFSDIFILSALTRDLGGWFANRQSHVNRYLFVKNDKLAKVFVSASALPRLGSGRLQIGISVVRFMNETNSLDKQWFTTLSYYVGPLRLITAWRPELFRSGLAMRFGRFEANVAQEWINLIETGRKAQPRFTLEITTGL